MGCAVGQGSLLVVEALTHDWLGGHPGVGGTVYRVKLSGMPLGFEPLYFWIGGEKLGAERKGAPNFVYAHRQNQSDVIPSLEPFGTDSESDKKQEVPKEFQGKNVLAFKTKNSNIQYIEIPEFRKSNTQFYE